MSLELWDKHLRTRKELTWIDENIDTYGIDPPFLMNGCKDENDQTTEDLKALIPNDYIDFVDNILESDI